MAFTLGPSIQLDAILQANSAGTPSGNSIQDGQGLALSTTRYIVHARNNVGGTDHTRVYVLDNTGVIKSTTDLAYMTNGQVPMLVKISDTEYLEASASTITGTTQTVECRRIQLVSDVPTIVDHQTTTGLATDNISPLIHGYKPGNGGPGMVALSGNIALFCVGYGRSSFSVAPTNAGFGLIAIDITTRLPLWFVKNDVPFGTAYYDHTVVGTGIFVSGTEVTLYGQAYLGSTHTMEMWRAKFTVTTSGATTTEALNIISSWDGFVIDQNLMLFGNPYLNSNQDVWTTMSTNQGGDNHDELELWKNEVQLATHSDNGVGTGYSSYYPAIAPSSELAYMAFVGYQRVFATSRYEDGVRLMKATPATSTFENTGLAIPVVNTVAGDTTWSSWQPGTAARVHLNPATNAGLIVTDWRSKHTSSDATYYSVHVFIVTSEIPIDPVRSALAFDSQYTSRATARLTVRPVNRPVIESVLIDTPGQVATDPSVTNPTPRPETAVSIYPGEAQPVIDPPTGSPTGYGTPLDPGLIPTFGGFPKLPQLAILCDTLVSTTGEFLAAARDLPSGVTLGTQARFLASDFASNTIHATADSVLPWSLTGNGTPTKITLVYRRGKEVFSLDAVNLDPGQYLSAAFGSVDNVAFTVSGVFATQAPLGYALLGTSDLTVSATPSWSASYTGRSLTSTIPVWTTQTTPYFITVVVNPPNLSVYISTGAGKTQSFTVKGTSTNLPALDLLVGKGAGVDAIANVEMLELSVDTYARTADQVEALNAVYGSIYGQG